MSVPSPLHNHTYDPSRKRHSEPGREVDFMLCLTHDVDRLYKTYQGPYYAIRDRSFHHVEHYLSEDRPYWQFETVMDLESQFGVRSTFYFLNEQRLFSDKSPREWIDLTNWKLFVGRYDIDHPAVREAIATLDRGGWEIGLHGSYESYCDRDRLRYEKTHLEYLLGHAIGGGRQHYLNLDRPETWEHHRSIGLKYDTSLGSSSEYGFDYGYHVLHPFDDDFTVFPTTIMDNALMHTTDSVEEAWQECERLLESARDNQAVMTVLWHPRVFNQRDFSGYAEIYERLIERALEMDAWVGPIDEAYTLIQ